MPIPFWGGLLSYTTNLHKLKDVKGFCEEERMGSYRIFRSEDLAPLAPIRGGEVRS